ncbi:unnamed protein product [Allacma fusca]|uniref:Uncharacterized protein n=1 Tax=Allacma fusca TaxID=39272 RepID=A0A8J2NS30_9HEXA|nr:unnamed protein product [Allacma fusca]
MKYFLVLVCVSIDILGCLAVPTKRTNVNFLDSALRSKPRAKLYFEKNHRGPKISFEQAELLEVDGCFLKNRPGKPVKSISPLGTCLRLFELPYCSGRSLAVYPGSPYLNDLQTNVNFKVKSLGPCLENEFENAKVVKKDGKQQILKDPALLQSYDSIPDILLFDGTDKLLVEHSDIERVEVYPGEFYFHGMKNQRLDFIWARVNSSMNLQVFFEKLRTSLKEGVRGSEVDLGKMDKGSFEDTFALDLCQVMWNIETAADEEIDLFINFLYSNESDAKPRASSYSIQSESVIKNGLVKIL